MLSNPNANITTEFVLKFLENNRVCLGIMTPTYDGKISTSFYHSLTNTISLLASVGIPAKVLFLEGDSLVHRARNNVLARAMEDNSCFTHLMFIDSDITWYPIHVLQLILRNKDLIGGLYPKKCLKLSKLLGPNHVQLLLSNKSKYLNPNAPNEHYLEAAILDYNYNIERTGIKINNLVMPVKEIATGFMMFKRGVITEMYKHFPETKYNCDIGCLTPAQNEFAYCLFDSQVVNQRLVSEDYLFCQRWASIGGEVFADLDIELVHTGQYHYRGAVLASLNLSEEGAPPALLPMMPASSSSSSSSSSSLATETNKRRRVDFEHDELEEMDA